MIRILQLVRAVLGSRFGAGRWPEWAAKNPEAAAISLEAFAVLADHRATLLGQRPGVWRRRRRVNRLIGLAEAARRLARFIGAGGGCPALEQEVPRG